MSNLYIDLEAYSEANLKKYGSLFYAKHPSTEILVVAFALDDDPVTSFVPDADQTTPEELKLLGFLNDKTIKIVMHNVQFDYGLLKHVAAARMNYPELDVARLICTQVLARALNLPPKLEKLAAYLKLPVQKNPEGEALIEFFSKLDKKGNRNLMSDNPIQAKAFVSYCETDVEVTRLILKAIPMKDLSEVEKTMWLLDFKINGAGIPVDLKLVTACAELVKERVDQKTKEFEDLFGFRPTQRDRFIEFLDSKGVNIKNAQRATLEALEDMPPDVKKAVGIRLAISKASVKKFSVMQAAQIDGRIYGSFLYQAAVTGRWSSKVVQFQNIARPTVYHPEEIERFVYEGLASLKDRYKNPLAALSSLLRHVIKSDVGFCVIDFSSIEARVIAWLAGQQDILKVFRDGGDVYSHTAAKIFKVERATDKQRFIGKVATLALGYQGGAGAFAKMAETFKMFISEYEATKIKDDWRSVNDKIVKLWKDVERTAMKVITDGQTRKLGKLEFGVFKTWFYIKLPSGRTLNYPDPSVDKGLAPWGELVDKISYYGLTSKTKQWERIETFGGKLVENITQALGRDLLRDSLSRLDQAGYNVVMHVHDSAVVECRDELAVIEKLFTYVPSWAKGLPVDAESYFSHNYKK